jgi:hypothetical protein
MRPPRSGRVPIDYAVLLQRPVDVVVELLWALEIEPDRAAIEGAVSRGSGQVADFPAAIGETPQFVPRQLASSRYFDEELLPIFESLVLSAFPSWKTPAASRPSRRTVIRSRSSARRA